MRKRRRGAPRGLGGFVRRNNKHGQTATGHVTHENTYVDHFIRKLAGNSGLLVGRKVKGRFDPESNS